MNEYPQQRNRHVNLIVRSGNGIRSHYTTRAHFNINEIISKEDRRKKKHANWFLTFLPYIFISLCISFICFQFSFSRLQSDNLLNIHCTQTHTHTKLLYEFVSGFNWILSSILLLASSKTNPHTHTNGWLLSLQPNYHMYRIWQIHQNSIIYTLISSSEVNCLVYASASVCVHV